MASRAGMLGGSLTHPPSPGGTAQRLSALAGRRVTGYGPRDGRGRGEPSSGRTARTTQRIEA
eukprot:103948-Pleurochrysis_carterae.AAC.1